MTDRIVILGKTYDVLKVTDIESAGNLGNAKRSKQIITLNFEQCAPEQLEETLLHEVLHIIDGELVLNLPEETIARLAVGIYSAGYRI